LVGGPRNQLFRRVSPIQAKRRLENGLAMHSARDHEQPGTKQCADKLALGKQGRISHRPTVSRLGLSRKLRSRGLRSGFALVEATVALSILTIVGLILLQLSLNVIQPRQYSLQQVLSDAYLTFERSTADRIPFEDLIATDSPWPAFPNIETTPVEIGRLPGGRAVLGEVTRTRFADQENYPIDGGAGTVATNPAAMKIWKVQSVLRYQIAERTYVKSRTFVRAQ